VTEVAAAGPWSARWWRRGLLGAGLFAAAALAARAWMRWPDVRRLAMDNPVAVEAAWGAGNASQEREPIWVGLREISPHLMRAVVVAEDIEFFSHHGFSWSEIRAAFAEASAGGRPRGASTITQQLAKNLWLAPERSAWRKLREAALTVDLERFLSKRRILELYLNVVPFGPGATGAEAAARTYFGKPALFLTEREAAMLAAGLSRPSVWNPANTSDAYRARVELILRRMANAEFLWRHIASL
jgi:monofunctional biosynthetic peptidoglycan transglycosylase